MTLALFADQIGYRLSTRTERLDVFIAAVARKWTLNVYATDTSPAIEDASFDEAEAAAADDISLVYLTAHSV